MLFPQPQPQPANKSQPCRATPKRLTGGPLASWSTRCWPATRPSSTTTRSSSTRRSSLASWSGRSTWSRLPRTWSRGCSCTIELSGLATWRPAQRISRSTGQDTEYCQLLIFASALVQVVQVDRLGGGVPAAVEASHCSQCELWWGHAQLWQLSRGGLEQCRTHHREADGNVFRLLTKVLCQICHFMLCDDCLYNRLWRWGGGGIEISLLIIRSRIHSPSRRVFPSSRRVFHQVGLFFGIFVANWRPSKYYVQYRSRVSVWRKDRIMWMIGNNHWLPFSTDCDPWHSREIL